MRDANGASPTNEGVEPSLRAVVGPRERSVEDGLHMGPGNRLGTELGPSGHGAGRYAQVFGEFAHAHPGRAPECVGFSAGPSPDYGRIVVGFAARSAVPIAPAGVPPEIRRGPTFEAHASLVHVLPPLVPTRAAKGLIARCLRCGVAFFVAVVGHRALTFHIHGPC